MQPSVRLTGSVGIADKRTAHNEFHRSPRLAAALHEPALEDTIVHSVPPLVSIVVPCFIRSGRDAALLDETLATVDAQTWQHYEVIVVDDGSPHEFGGLIRNHSHAALVRRSNGGSAMARNTGTAASRGRFVVFLDADDHLLPEALEVGVTQLMSNPDCGFAIGPREEMTYDGTPVPWSVPVPPSADNLYLALLGFDWYVIPPSSVMFRREVVDRLGGFRDPWGADDLDFYLRAARLYRAISYQSPAVTRYRRYSASSSRDGERMLQSIREVYRREWPYVTGHEPAERAFHRGLAQLTAIFADCLVENLEDRVRAREWRRAARSAAMLARESPRRLISAMPRAVRRAYAAVSSAGSV
jgi:glycosyltransferase involved in cell wall biosynthesis